MNWPRIIAVIVMLVAAGFCAMLALAAMEPAPVVAEAFAPSAPPSTTPVLTAAHDLGAGSLLKDDDIASTPVLAEALPPDAIVDTPATRADLRGALLRRFTEAGRRLTRDDVLRLHDRGFLAAVLAPGTRAISVGVDVITGASGLIWPGDRVDVILVQDLDQGGAVSGAGGSRRVAGETILTGARVIAVDQQLSLAPQGSPAAVGEGRVARTISLEVTPAQAEKLAVAQRLGQVALTVRPIELSEAAAPDGRPTYGADVSAALIGRSPAPRTMRVFQGTEMQEATFR